jgi:hypothetical protein
MSYVGGPAQPTEPTPADDNSKVVVPVRVRPSVWSNPLVIFAGALLLAALTFASSLALLTRVGVLESPLDEVPTTSVPTRSATPAPAAVRVTAGTASAERLESGAYRVVFTWTLDGAREGDTALLRFSLGSRVISEQRGALDPPGFSSSTGRFAVTTSQECSADGWSAEIVTIRGVAPLGEATSRAPGVTCR